MRIDVRGGYRPVFFFFAFDLAFFGCVAGAAAGFTGAADFSSSRWRCSFRANFASRMARN